MPANHFNTIDAGILSSNSADVNAAALQRLIDGVQATGGGTITIPAGIYAINGTISLNPPVGLAIEIRGCDGAMLAQTAGVQVPLFKVGGEDEECGDVAIAHLLFGGDRVNCAS